MKSNTGMSIKKMFLIYVIAVSLLAAGIMSVVNKGLTTIDKKAYKGSDLMGKSVVIQKDTLMILKYNVWLNQYTLSNGIAIDSALLKTHKPF